MLTEKAAWLRRELFEMVVRQGKGHLASAFSSIEILVALYYDNVLNLPTDRLIISKGHATIGLYPILADLGYFPVDELKRYTQPDGLLGMYADIHIPGIEAISGSLGHGLGIAAGFALADRTRRTYVILGDGECYEGSVWESAIFIAHYRLNNLIVIVDRNELCILGKTETLLRLDNLEEKWHSFGWATVSVDGHSFNELAAAFRIVDNRPLVIIAKTVKGKGISFMEGRPEWHGGVPSGDQIAQARNELQ